MLWGLELLPFLCGALLAAWLFRRVRRGWWLALVAPALPAACAVLIVAAPFAGWAMEALLGLIAALALVPVFLAFQRYGHDNAVPARAGWANTALNFALLPLMVAVMMPWTVRLHYARRVAWECDGTVESKFRSNNHNAAALVVQTEDGPVTLDGVEESTWHEVAVGDHLQKPAGSAFGRLNGARVRVVPRVMPWWNEPT